MFIRQNLDFRQGVLDFRQGGLDFSQVGLNCRKGGLDSGRAVSIFRRSENNKSDAKVVTHLRLDPFASTTSVFLS